MMRRLAESGLVSVRQKREGQRMVRYFRCTKSGERALTLWLNPPFPDLLGFDLLRTQILYLDRLSKAQQRRWFKEAKRSLQDKLQLIQSMATEVASNPSMTVFEELAHDNAILQIRARLKWLSNCEKRILVDNP